MANELESGTWIVIPGGKGGDANLRVPHGRLC